MSKPKSKKKRPARRSKRGQPSASKRQEAGATGSTAWRSFAARYPNHPALKNEAIYALPEKLIGAIKEEKIDLLSDDERAFELDLSRTAGIGFFLKRVIDFPLLSTDRQSEVNDKIQARQRDADAQIKELIAQEMRKAGRSDLQIANYLAGVEEKEQSVQERRLAFAGWLVTDPGFRKSRDEFCAKWQRAIHRLGRFPTVPTSVLGETPPGVPTSQRPLYIAALSFFQKWCLECLSSWDLPLPMCAELNKASLYDLSSVGDAGLTIFLPWFLLRDKQLSVHDLLAPKKLFAAPKYLNGWLKQEGNREGLGYRRYAIMLQLFIYLELGLKRRYGNRLQHKTEALDRAFGTFLYDDRLTGPENIKKIRREMNRRLRRDSP